MKSPVRLSALLALSLILAACSTQSATTVLPQQTSSLSRPEAPNGVAAQTGATLSQPNTRKVCGPVSDGYARCFSIVRTDVGGTANPNVPGYGPADLQA